jgi:hypothetical protein
MVREENWGSELTNAGTARGDGVNRGCKIQIFVGGEWFDRTNVYPRAPHNTITRI